MLLVSILTQLLTSCSPSPPATLEASEPIGLPGRTPGFGAHFILVPLAGLTGALPLPAAGLGAFEAAIDYLYVQFPPVGAVVAPGQGLMVALAYRMITVVIALIGWCYYLAARKEVAKWMQAAEADLETQ